MKFSDFTKEQQLAITKSGQNIIVSAGAGSGKTAVLTQRVLYFIKEKGYKLDEFLILTFTKLASGEMKERIRKALTDEGLEEANKVDTASITTFDAYALSLVQKYHFLLHLSPNIKIIDTNIISVRKRTIIEEIFEENYQKEEPAFIEMIKKYCFKDDLDLQNLVLKLSDKANLELNTEEYLNNYLDAFYKKEVIKGYIDYFTKEFTDTIDELKEKIVNLPNVVVNKKNKLTYKESVEDYLEMLLNAITYDEITRSFRDASYPRKPSGISESEEEVIQDIKELYVNLKKQVNSLPETENLFYKQFEDEMPFVKVLIDIVKELHIRIDAYKKEYDVYEFQDIAKMALRIVSENSEIRDELKNKLKMIMIDEYQDTSLLQEEFISKIANNNVYMVGDIKQSIYRFRNAKSEIFANKYQKFLDNEGGFAINLNKNFRSRKEVLQDINYLFKQIMTLDLGKADYQKDHLIEYGNKSYIEPGVPKETRHSSFIIYPPQKNSLDVPMIEAKLIAKDIIDKMNNHYQVYAFDKKLKKPIFRDCRFSDFCILMDRGSSFDTYAKIFNEYQIPLFVENDENISSNEVVLILTNFLRLIKTITNNEYQSIEFKKAFLSIARSFLYQYSDQKLFEIASSNTYFEDPIILELKEIINTNRDLSIARLFSKILLKLEVYEKCARIGNLDKNEKYLDTFIQMFQEMSTLDYSIDDFIMYMEYIDEYKLKITLSSTGSTLDSVKIMNIHKSKGLEFSIVYFSGLKKTFNQLELSEKFGVSTNYGLILPPDDEEKQCIPKFFNKIDERLEDVSEKIRLLYVSLTRTKEKMIFILENSSYYEDKYKQDLNQAKEYIHKYLKNMDNQDALKIVLQDYQEGKINTQVVEFVLILTKIHFPISFLHFNKVKKDECSKEMVIDKVDYFESFIIPYFEELMKEGKTTYDTLENVFQRYFNDEISIENVIDISQVLGCTFTMKFYEQIRNGKLNLSIDECLKMYQRVDTSISHDILTKQLQNLNYRLLNKEISEDIAIKFQKYISDASREYGGLELVSTNEKTNVEKVVEFKMLKFFKREFDEGKISYLDLLTFVELLYIHFTYFDPVLNRLFKEPRVSNTYLSKVLDYLGICLTNYSEEIIKRILNKDIAKEEYELYLETPLVYKFALKDRFFQNVSDEVQFPFSNVIYQMYLDFKNDVITLDELEKLIDVLGFEFNVEFKNQSVEEKKQYTREDIVDIFVEEGEILKGRENNLSFYDFIYPFYQYRKFETVVGELELNKQLDNQKTEKVIHQNLQIEELNLEIKEVKQLIASKELKIDSNKNNRDFGTKIHFIMEIMDFKNPDYSIIQESLYQTVVKKFLASPLMKNIKKGNIYKEYEYFDEEENVNGIIDLMVIYDEYIDVIDYKTKNIDDESYNKQLKLYSKFVRKTFHKEVNSYLYSLLTGEWKKVS